MWFSTWFGLIGNVLDAYISLCLWPRIQCFQELGYSLNQSFWGGPILFLSIFLKTKKKVILYAFVYWEKREARSLNILSSIDPNWIARQDWPRTMTFPYVGSKKRKWIKESIVCYVCKSKVHIQHSHHNKNKKHVHTIN